MRELLSAWWSVLTQPWRFLADVERVAAFRRPIWLYSICTTAAAVAAHVYYDESESTGVLSGLLLGALRAVPALYFQAGVLHLALRLFGGSGRFAITLRACALAAAPALLAIIPWVGWLGELWCLVLLVFALSRVHLVSLPRATAGSLGPIVLLVVAALGVRTFIVEAFKISGGSMSPGLLLGDHIFVEKYAYRNGKLPALGEVVVFEYPYSTDGTPQDFAKRVVGLPGNVLRFEGGFLSIDGSLVPVCLVGRARLPRDTLGAEFDIYVERLGAQSHLVAIESGSRNRSEGPYVVPAGEVWMAGDNRSNSLDSRFWRREGSTTAGAGVPASFIKGRASRIWFPAKRFWTPIGAEPTLPPELSTLAPGLRACQVN